MAINMIAWSGLPQSWKPMENNLVMESNRKYIENGVKNKFMGSESILKSHGKVMELLCTVYHESSTRSSDIWLYFHILMNTRRWSVFAFLASWKIASWISHGILLSDFWALYSVITARIMNVWSLFCQWNGVENVYSANIRKTCLQPVGCFVAFPMRSLEWQPPYNSK